MHCQELLALIALTRQMSVAEKKCLVIFFGGGKKTAWSVSVAAMVLVITISTLQRSSCFFFARILSTDLVLVNCDIGLIML